MIAILSKSNFWLQNVPLINQDDFSDDIYNKGVPYDLGLNYLKPKLIDGVYIEGATSEEIEAYNDSLYPLTVTALQFKLELVYSGLKVEVESALNSLEEPNKTIAWLHYDKSTEFDRKNSLIQELGTKAGMTKQDINEFFLRASER